LRVIVGSDTDRMDQRSLTFRIESEMWAQPLPLNLYLKSEVDLETGGVNVTEGAG
jgi:type VI secretion system protein ImpF